MPLQCRPIFTMSYYADCRMAGLIFKNNKYTYIETHKSLSRFFVENWHGLYRGIRKWSHLLSLFYKIWNSPKLRKVQIFSKNFKITETAIILCVWWIILLAKLLELNESLPWIAWRNSESRIFTDESNGAKLVGL